VAVKSILICTLLFSSFTLVACSKSESLTQLPQGEFAAPPEYVTIKIMGYVPQAGDTFQNLFVSNYSVTAKNGQLFLNTARDMADTFKQSLAASFGFTTLSPESAVAGFADLMLYQAGVNLSQQNLLVCSSSLQASSSNDGLTYNDDRYTGSPITFLGLRDCDKVYLGLNPSKFSYNGSGIPDYLQMRCGLNPLNTNEAFVSTAGDGVQNIDKCKRNIPIDESAYTQPNQLFAYQYNTQHNLDGTTDFTISNIPILNHGDENFVAFYVTEINPSTNTPSLYTAYAVLKNGYNSKTLQFNYWATSSATFYNQEVVVP
jgi:hypothetical protein